MTYNIIASNINLLYFLLLKALHLNEHPRIINQSILTKWSFTRGEIKFIMRTILQINLVLINAKKIIIQLIFAHGYLHNIIQCIEKSHHSINFYIYGIILMYK